MKALSKPTDIKIGSRYKVVEGLHDGKEGVVSEHVVSSFGYVWIKLQQDDGTFIKTRWSDLESA